MWVRAEPEQHLPGQGLQVGRVVLDHGIVPTPASEISEYAEGRGRVADSGPDPTIVIVPGEDDPAGDHEKPEIGYGIIRQITERPFLGWFQAISGGCNRPNPWKSQQICNFLNRHL